MPREHVPPNPSERAASDGSRREVVVRVPLARLFSPESDPSVRFPDHSAEVEGFAFTPEGVTVALVVRGPHAGILADEVWSGLERHGQAIRRTMPHDEKGRALLVMTIRTPAPEALVEVLRRSLLLPVRAQQGTAELHLALAGPEAALIRDSLAALGVEAVIRESREVRDVIASESLSAEDWGFLGLLCALHVFDGPVLLDPSTVARRLGIEPSVFDRKVRTVEAGMKELVAGLFEPPVGSPAAGVAA